MWRHRRRARRGFSAIEVAAGIAIFGSILAAALPTFVRELHGSHLVEATDGLQRIATGALRYAAERPVESAFPNSAPLTPASVPHGTRVVDPPGTWETPTWRALAFRPGADDAPHAFAFAFTSTPGAGASHFVAEAHADLDGDGVTSTLEVRGSAQTGSEPALAPGMYVEAELE